MNDNLPPSEDKRKHYAKKAVEVGLQLVPVAGGPLATVWAEYAGSAFEKRRHVWEARITSDVAELISRTDGLSAESIVQSSQFLDAVAFATRAATTTGQRHKLEALRNAVLNAAVSDIDADTQAMFLGYVRDFTPTHLRLLKLFDSPKQWFDELGVEWPTNVLGGTLGAEVIERGLPDLAGRPEVYDTFGGDLRRAGLLNTDSFHVNISSPGLETRRTTSAGREFLRFITEPPQMANDPVA